MITSELKRRERKYELIYQALKREIESGEMAEGVALESEAQLCDRFDVSRGPVRQALAALEREGLIRRMAGKGSFVFGDPSRPSEGVAENGAKQLVAVINTSGVSPANFVAFELVDGLNHAAEEAGQGFQLNYQFHRRAAELESLSIPPCQGMIMAPLTFEGVRTLSSIAERQSLRVPLVSLYNRVDVDHIAQFYIDHEAGAMEATDFLLRYGHQRITMLTEPAISPGPAMAEREAGFRKAVEAAGLSASSGTVLKVGLDPVMQLANIEHLLKRIDRPTALVVAGGVITRSVIQAVRNVGLRVPDALSIVAFDDTPEAAMNDPRLTVVRVPLRRIARMGMEWLVEQINGGFGPRAPVSMPVKPELIVGRSCGPVAGSGDSATSGAGR